MAGLHDTTQPSIRPVQVEDDVLIRPPMTQEPSMVDVFHRSTVDCENLKDIIDALVTPHLSLSRSLLSRWRSHHKSPQSALMDIDLFSNFTSKQSKKTVDRPLRLGKTTFINEWSKQLQNAVQVLDFMLSNTLIAYQHQCEISASPTRTYQAFSRSPMILQ
jgi:hypothetical protein